MVDETPRPPMWLAWDSDYLNETVLLHMGDERWPFVVGRRDQNDAVIRAFETITGRRVMPDADL